MIVGRGLLANTLATIDDPKYLFYANGISNSVMDHIPENNAEFNEIMKFSEDQSDRLFVYFSTSQVNSRLNYERPYVQHKARIENLIKENFQHYLIIRTTNLVGFNAWNKHTLFNFLYNALIGGNEITVNRDVVRNVLDADHFRILLSCYLASYQQGNATIEIDNPISYSMAQILERFESYFSKKFNVHYVQTEKDFALFELNEKLTSNILATCNIDFNDQYIYRLLQKYYSRS